MSTVPPCAEDPSAKRLKVEGESSTVKTNHNESNPREDDDLTAEGNPRFGDSERCKTCNKWQDYICDDTYMCFDCDTQDPHPALKQEVKQCKVEQKVPETNHNESNPWDDDDLTGEGVPRSGDSERCKTCNKWQDYICDDTYMCFQCDTGDPVTTHEPDDEPSDPDDDDDWGDDDSNSNSQKDKEKRILPESDSVGFCSRCDKSHDWSKDEFMNCVPPIHIIQFGEYRMNHEYRRAVDQYCHLYDTEEIMGSFLGHNPHFPNFEKWTRKQNRDPLKKKKRKKRFWDNSDSSDSGNSFGDRNEWSSDSSDF